MHLQEVILHTASITRTKQFYTKTLELQVEVETEDTISFKAGNSALTFRSVADQKPVYHIAFNITNNKFSDSFEWLNAKLDILTTDNGLPIAVYDNWHAESFYFHDNNGNILEFITRFDLPSYSTEPFGTADILEISEAGIVCDDVAAMASDLHKKYGFPYFAKSKPTENFSVLGDDHGLLIITKNGRGWVPTNKPAHIFPMTIIADGHRIAL